MLSALEALMKGLRRVKLYITLGGAVASGLALAIVQMTRDLMMNLSRAGDDFMSHLAASGWVAILVVAGIGIGVMASFFKHDGEPKLQEIPIYIGIGALAIGGFFWFIPAVSHMIAVEVLSPALKVLAGFLNGDATVSLKLLLKLLFLIYLASFLIDALVQHFIKGNDVASAMEEMAQKYWKEILDVLHDIWEAIIFLPRLVFRSKQGSSDE